LYLRTEIFFEGIELYVNDSDFLKQIRKDSNFLIPKTIAKLMGGIQHNIVEEKIIGT